MGKRSQNPDSVWVGVLVFVWPWGRSPGHGDTAPSPLLAGCSGLRHKVLDVRKAHGVDVGKTRLENRRESKMAWRSSLTDNEAKTQNVLGFATAMLIGLGALLRSMRTPHPLPFLLAALAFIMKKVKANKVLFVKEAHGEDGKTRREHRQEQRRESNGIWRAALKTVLLAVAALALILAIDNALVFSVTL